jgi:acyl-coenzyme A synthetase/AMP-(fatty) acid ligase
MLRLAPLAFDASTLEVFAPLIGGGCIEIHPPGVVASAELARFLLEREVDVLWLTAGLFRLMAEFAPHGFARVVHVLTGGDVVAPEQVHALLTRYPGLRVTNGYGPTENTTFSTVAHFDDASAVTDPLPIGTPVPGSGALVLDAAGRPVPPGGTGELYVTGLGLALDYAGDPGRTAEVFGVVPAAGERAYRTGDLVRLTGAGQLRFLGRTDRQVKIRGFRVELDEIRQALTGMPGVQDAAVVAVGTDASRRRLAAGIVPDGSTSLSPPELAARLSRTLPGYYVPALWSVLDEIPLTTNGKVDSAAVAAGARPLDEGDAAEAGDADGPDLAAELASAAWTQVLGRAPSGPDADFFRAGGDSLAFARMVAWLTTAHGVRVAPRDLYASPTFRTLSELIRPELAAVGGRPS